MNTPRSFCRFILALFLVGTLPTSCKKSGDPAAQTECRLTSQTATGTSTFAYDAKGQLVDIKEFNGSRQTYSYTNEGFLQTVTSFGSNGTLTGKSAVEYTNGLVTRITETNASGAVSLTRTITYDTSGNLARVVSTRAGGSTTTSLFTNGKQTGYVDRTVQGVETQPYTFDNGLVKEYRSVTSLRTYTYDGLSRLIRFEQRESNRLTNYVSYEYLPQAKASRYAQPVFKGIPNGGRDALELNNGVEGVLAKESYVTYPTTGSSYLSFESTYSHTLNGSGFPLESTEVSRSLSASGAVLNSTTYRTTYTYAGCL